MRRQRRRGEVRELTADRLLAMREALREHPGRSGAAQNVRAIARMFDVPLRFVVDIPRRRRKGRGWLG